jgi:CheY-specific phosphatase CheX
MRLLPADAGVLRKNKVSAKVDIVVVQSLFLSSEANMVKTWQESAVVYGTEDILTSLCNSVTRVLNVATQSQIQYSGMVQRISKTCLKPDIGCFVLFDGGFSGLVVLNFSAATAMELYENYMINMGMPKSELASSHTSDEVSNIMGELMNQIVGDFTGKVRRELQTNITQNQPKMLVLNKQVVLSVDTQLDKPESRRVTFYTSRNNIFYLELAIDRTEFIKLHDFDAEEEINPDDLIAQTNAGSGSENHSTLPAIGAEDQDELLKSLGM